ncbi:MAG TPA: DUF1684 domain-containing protein [Terriglobales bacterium]|nr:DUF1684 domain-containing protein [Terriglobales bacterium]
MKIKVWLLALTLLALTTTTVASDKPSSGPDSWRQATLKWRADRAARLQAPEGWLSLIGLEWLKEGDNSVGSAPDNRIQIAKAPAHLAVVRLDHGAIRLQPPQGGFPKDLFVDGHPPQEQPLYADDAANPSKLKVGTLTVILIHRDERIGLRIKDLDAPGRTGFHGLRWYAPDPKYRVRAKWIPYNPPKMLDIPTILGTTDKLPAPGAAEFTLAGQTVRLEPVLEDPDSKELFFILRDTTSRATTYGSGRFLYTELPDHGVSQPGEVWLDLNQLINPPCAFTPYATCPLPPPQNRLQIAIPAGEQRYHD